MGALKIILSGSPARGDVDAASDALRSNVETGKVVYREETGLEKPADARSMPAMNSATPAS